MNAELVIAIVFLGVIPVTMTYCGTLPVRATTTRSAINRELGIRVATMFWILLLYAVVVPSVRQVLDDFDTEVPSLTFMLLRCTDLGHILPRLGFAMVLILLMAETALFAQFRATTHRVIAANRMSIATSGFVAAGFLVVLISLTAPLLKLLNDLA